MNESETNFELCRISGTSLLISPANPPDRRMPPFAEACLNCKKFPCI